MKKEGVILKAGIHELTLKEVEKKFCFNAHRKALFKGLKKVVRHLISVGAGDIYIDGSFTGDKEFPSDIDGCWVASDDLKMEKIDPVLLDFSGSRKRMKEKFGVDFFIADWTESGSGEPFLEFFQTDRDGNRKGIVKIKRE
ncbi:MAG: hypothetical protein JKY23_02975 [Nitrospinaceae bacterium]|nr:hypothetical protein [Nitrospinaceae bacterium]